MENEEFEKRAKSRGIDIEKAKVCRGKLNKAALNLTGSKTRKEAKRNFQTLELVVKETRRVIPQMTFKGTAKDFIIASKAQMPLTYQVCVKWKLIKP